MSKRFVNKRRNYFIDKNFQLRYAACTLIFILIAFVIFGLVFYQVGFLPLLEKLKNVYPEARLFVILNSVYRHLGVSFFILIIIAFCFAIFRSHRIAGSVFSLKRHISRMNAGDFSGIVRLRKRDDLQTLADELNTLNRNIGLLIEKLRSRTKSMREVMNEFNSRIKSEPDESSPSAEPFSKLETEMKQLQEVLEQYRI